jgi:UDPglucose 6-dehydrogenase
MREAPSLELIRHLTALGMWVRAFDPVAGENARSILAGNDLVTVCADQYEALSGAAALAVVTEWNQFRNPDFGKIKKALSAPILFDGRNLYSPALMAVEGFAYFCVGR